MARRRLPRRSLMGALGLAVTVAIVISGCGSSQDSSSSGSGNAQSGGGKKEYSIYLANSFLGNDWRVQMEKAAQAAVQHAPLKGRVNLRVENSENTVSAQTASLNSIIQRKPDAILVDPASPTGLNPVLERACQQGILVVSFDQTSTAPCSYQVHTDFGQSSKLGASWMAKTLGGKGNLIEDTGLAGAAVSKTITDGFDAVLKSQSGIKIAGTYQGQYALGPEQQGVASQLAANPKVDGILTQGYCTGAMQALKNAGRGPVPMYCQAYNGTFVACAKDHYPCIITANPAWLGAEAIKQAVDILDGNKPASKDIVVPSPCFVTNDQQPDGATCDKIELGKNAYPDMPPGLTLPVSPKWTDIQPSEVAK